jgi:hypothetical protein
MSDSPLTAETILIPWFNANIKPRKNILWISAVAPEPLQGSPRLLDELLKRPLEAPDAMGRRRAIARYGSCLIAHAIALTAPNLKTLNSILSQVEFFRNPDSILNFELPEELQPTLKQLVAEGFDPSETWELQLSKVIQTFQTGLHHLQQLFGIPKNRKFMPIITSFFTNATEWWGVSYHPEEKVLNILPPYLFIPALAQGLILREAVRLCLPTSFHLALDTQEFASTLTEHLLPAEHKKTWSMLRWGGTQLSPDQIKALAQVTQFTLQLLQQDHLPSLMTRLTQLDNIAELIPTGGLTLAARQEFNVQPTVPPLTRVHQAILLALIENPSISERQLAKETNFARGTISRNLNELHDAFNLRVSGELNYSRIGLVPLLLSVSTPNPTNIQLRQILALAQRLETFPYCQRLTPFASVIGSSIYAMITLPPKIIPSFQRYFGEWASHNALSSWLARISAFEWGWYFRWWTSFSSEEWLCFTESNLRKINNPEGANNHMQYQGTQFRLTREALRILVTLEENMRISQRKLAKVAQTSITTASNYYSRFIPDIIKPFPELTTTPLSEVLTFSITSQPLLSNRQLIASYRLLPAYQIWHLTSINEAKGSFQSPPFTLVSTSLPKGGGVQFTTALSKAASQHNAVVNIIRLSHTPAIRLQRLPFALFKTVGQEWTAPREKFLSQELFKNY